MTVSDDLSEQLRELLLDRVGDKLRMHKNAVKLAATLIDWEAIDGDDQGTVERAIATLRDDHAYLFGTPPPADIGAGRRHHAPEDDPRPVTRTGNPATDRIVRGYEEGERGGRPHYNYQ
jgi:hypothetical protein